MRIGLQIEGFLNYKLSFLCLNFLVYSFFFLCLRSSVCLSLMWSSVDPLGRLPSTSVNSALAARKLRVYTVYTGIYCILIPDSKNIRTVQLLQVGGRSTERDKEVPRVTIMLFLIDSIIDR